MMKTEDLVLIVSNLHSATKNANDCMESLHAALVELFGERDQLKAELAKLQAEREPRDNGDGTVTAMRPVTYPKGLDAECARTRRKGDLYATSIGTADVSDSDESPATPGNIWLILRPAPQPTEPVTWEASMLIDGEWEAGEDYVEGPEYCFEWGKLRGLTKPPILGTYQFKDGVGTLIREAI